MRATIRLFFVFVFGVVIHGSANAMQPGDRVDNFRLLDQAGTSHELYYHSDAKAVVLMVHGVGCPIVRQSLPALDALRKDFAKRGVEFLMINSNTQDDRAALAREAAEFGIDLPILRDETQLVGEALGVTRTAEVFVIDPKTWKLAYRGAIDDRLSLGAQKPKAQHHYLTDALTAVVAGKPVAVKEAEAVGCVVNLTERDRKAEHAKISYVEQIAPLLQEKCVACHRPGGIGPWAMTSYENVRGFAPMIREVIRTKRMPPWFADPHVGKFVGDRSISNEEAQMLVHWIEAGAPRGNGDDPLKNVEPLKSQWLNGEPDMVVEIPAFEVPATGVVEYKYPQVANPLGKDVWVRAIQILPGNPAVVHHVLAGIADPQTSGRTGIEQLAAFGGYSPGRNYFVFPDNSGVLLRADANLQFQTHYTPNGKAVRDVTRVGYYLSKEPPKHEMRLQFLYDPSLRVPAGAKAHTESVEHTFRKNVLLYSAQPHAHLRGRAAKFTAFYPDGREEILLSVPRYDFNWQSVYLFQEPKILPAGTRIKFDMTWDNSAQNPANPDPTIEVRWGDQTWDEMNTGFLRYRDLEPGENATAMIEKNK
jgi:peroxiredoxin/mono/diheme cytochrome c family protein